MGAWVRLCNEKDLPAEGQAREFQAGGRTLCVATLKGQPVALDNVCPHRGGPLAEGTVEHGKIVCPWHQWEFDLMTGISTHSPHAKVARYELQREGSDILVKIGG
jgi:nitrite reductase (NADH) small subunit